MVHVCAWLSDAQVLIFFFLTLVALSFWQDSEVCYISYLCPIKLKTEVEIYRDTMTRQIAVDLRLLDNLHKGWEWGWVGVGKEVVGKWRQLCLNNNKKLKK